MYFNVLPKDFSYWMENQYLKLLAKMMEEEMFKNNNQPFMYELPKMLCLLLFIQFLMNAEVTLYSQPKLHIAVSQIFYQKKFYVVQIASFEYMEILSCVIVNVEMREKLTQNDAKHGITIFQLLLYNCYCIYCYVLCTTFNSVSASGQSVKIYIMFFVICRVFSGPLTCSTVEASF